jgi:hypothetical protein
MLGVIKGVLILIVQLFILIFVVIMPILKVLEVLS